MGFVKGAAVLRALNYGIKPSTVSRVTRGLLVVVLDVRKWCRAGGVGDWSRCLLLLGV